jgi:hypothetical protein
MGDIYDQESIDDSDSSGRDAEEFDGHEEGHVDEDDAEDRDEVVCSSGFYVMKIEVMIGHNTSER